MIGSVDNGFTAEVKINGKTFPDAQIRLRGDVAQIALMTRPGFMASFPRKIAVDGREMSATSARKVEDVKGMLVLTVDWVDTTEMLV